MTSLMKLYTEKLKSAFNEKEILLITQNQDFVPIILGGKPQRIDDILAQSFVANTKGVMYPVRRLGFGNQRR